MRKFIIGVVVGAFLFSGVQAFADSVSLIGKKVGSEAELYLDGKRMSDVIVVDGKSFAPVRELAEGLGRSVYYKDATEDEKAVVTLSAALFQQEQRIKTIKSQIEANEKEIKRLSDSKDYHENTIRNNTKNPLSEEVLKGIEEFKANQDARIAAIEEENKGLKIELEALESAE